MEHAIDGSVEKYKARAVFISIRARGFSQKEDYDETLLSFTLSQLDRGGVDPKSKVNAHLMRLPILVLAQLSRCPDTCIACSRGNPN